MSTTLETIFNALGYGKEGQQTALTQLLQASGAFGELPDVQGIISESQAKAILKHVTFDTPEQAAHWLHDATQAHMLRRPAGVERCQCEEPELFRRHRSELLRALDAAGMLSAKAPAGKHYDHVLVLGAMEGAVNERLDVLPKLWNEGVRFDKIHLLGSDRPLDPSEPVHADSYGKGTEMQMMIARAHEKHNAWPEELQKLSLHPVNTPQQAHGRANTQDTIRSFLKDEEGKIQLKAGDRLLIISSQPHVAYQEAAVKSVLADSFQVETIGAPAAEESLKISVGMDAIARQIDVGFPKLLEALKSQKNALPEPLVMLDPAGIKVDAATYQFRSGGNGATGVTQKGKFDAERWDPILHGNPVLVHERLDGTQFIADGHHRLDLATRLNAQGVGPGNIAAMVLRETDGYTAQDARIIAAYRNMAEKSRGRLEPEEYVDYARVVQEAQQLPSEHKQKLPRIEMKDNVKIFCDLAQLPKEALALVMQKYVPPEMAAKVPEFAPNNPDRQLSIMRIMAEPQAKNWTTAVDASRAPAAASLSR
ncbi:MAG: hypothetical protein KGJ06_04515 [Pseudomonadota bacterium]|nr:hypothetical protein [Pseudomonadota bacterium]